ncbi:MAG TPA: DoxX family protein [Chitinophagaceae bacterium]|nr:DoxX family protein [Chitinophagaceae bacterium]
MEQTISTSQPWSFVKKIIFRFCFLFFVFYIFLNPNGFFPYVDDVYGFYIPPFHNLIPWIGKHILHLSYDITVFTNGSGDTTYDYVILLFLTVMAAIGCIIWTLIDKKRASYNTLYYWLTTLVRYFLAFSMFNYGIVKIIKLQFPFPGLNTLMEPYGQSSPMGLAWNFIGFSKGYNYFTGIGEVTAGFLLLFRRTTRLGAILSLVIAGNIVAINFCFDVPVKLMSSALVVMSLFLLLQERRRLVNFFFRNKTAQPESMYVPKFKKKGLNTAMVIAKYVIIAFVLYNNLSDAITGMKLYGEARPKPPLYGIYSVKTFVRNHDTIAPLLTDTTRWRNLIINWPNVSTVKMTSDKMVYYAFRPDTTAKKIEMFSYADTTKKSHFDYSFIGNDSLVLKGKWMDDSVLIAMKKYDIKNFLLVNRGFHFINEYPLNR